MPGACVDKGDTYALPIPAFVVRSFLDRESCRERQIDIRVVCVNGKIGFVPVFLVGGWGVYD